VDIAQPIAYLLAVVVAVLAVGFGSQQRNTLHRLRSPSELPQDESKYLRTQAWLRIACCALMLVLAGLVAGAYASGMEARVTDLGRTIQAHRDRGEEVVISPEDKLFRKLYGGYWSGTLLVLFAIVVLAGIDIWMIRRFQRRGLAKINADRREMLEEQVAILRSRRNGHVE
jgi:hypothetical protein